MSSERAEALKYPILKGRWNDPDLEDKFRSFFVETYRVQLAEQRDAPPVAPSAASTDDKGPSLFHLGLDNLPEEHLPPDQFTFLLKARNDIRRWLDTPMPGTNDPSIAGVVLVRGYILRVALMFVEHLLFYLMFDSRFHPDRKIRAKAVGMFAYDEGVEDFWRRSLNAVTTFSAGCNLLFPHAGINAMFADEVRLLHLVGDVFFDTVQSVFPIKAVGKCRMAFTLLMKDLGTSRACDQVENYIRRRKTLYREMVAYEENGGLDGQNADMLAALRSVCRSVVAEEMSALVAKVGAHSVAIGENTNSIVENTKTIANMDRRQRTLLTFMKTTVSGFVQLFRPGRSSPSRENVGEALLPDDRFACLKNVKEPHVSQLRAVIQMTKDHPISRSEGKKSVFTLASAALAVWERDHEKWEKVPGSFETYGALKAACYGLAKDPKTNPFYYAQ